MKQCPFCEIVKEKSKATVMFENSSVLAIAPLKDSIIAPGHLLVIPKKHYENLYDIPEEELCCFVKSVKEIGVKLKKSGFNGFNLLNANGKAAQQSVFHLHFHLIPRKENDGLDTWPKTGYIANADIKQFYLKIKEQLK